MKYFIYIALILTTFVSCENDIPFNANNNTPKLIINTLLDSSKKENEIILAITGRDKTSNVKDAVIDIYVNGILKEHITQPTKNTTSKGYSSYITRISFVPQDIIRIDVKANGGEYFAWAEASAPHPIAIENIEIDEYTKQASDWGSSGQYVKAQTTFTDNRQGINYYRIAMNFDFEVETVSPYDQKDTLIFQTVVSDLIVDEDLVLTDGQPSVSNNDIYTPVYNEYGVFDNSRINGTYTMTTSMQVPYYYAGITDSWYNMSYYESLKKVKAKVRVKLMSISKDQYMYLKALNIYDSEDYDDYFNLPVKFPSNINGGTGIFGISTVNESLISLKDYIPENKYLK
ncbi:MAG: DUF4249 domain-containing protein [Dysgonomonas sp.]|uniref:DUF4249 domain-containing protein n=1 Tax=Dysgonomonas sp. TaxID=1891233 RepID=UPI0039E6B1C2